LIRGCGVADSFSSEPRKKFPRFSPYIFQFSPFLTKIFPRFFPDFPSTEPGENESATVADQIRVRKYSFGNPDTNKGEIRKGGERRKIPRWAEKAFFRFF
jgi:hypothetical protein